MIRQKIGATKCIEHQNPHDMDSLVFHSDPTGQGPHLTGSGHAKPVLNEVKDQI